LVTTQPLEGGETVEVIGMQPDGPLQFVLPTIRPRVRFHLNGHSEERPVMLDTVIIEPTVRRLQLVWRAALPCDKKTLKVREIEATLDGWEAPSDG
jgi:hypothetical protein